MGNSKTPFSIFYGYLIIFGIFKNALETQVCFIRKATVCFCCCFSREMWSQKDMSSVNGRISYK